MFDPLLATESAIAAIAQPETWQQLLMNPATYVSLVTLALLEIVLGVDNLVFVSILAGKLPKAQQPRARQLGLGLALVTRVILLCFIGWLVGLTKPLFAVSLPWTQASHGVSGRDLVLLLGGLFLLGKATHEIHHNLEGEDGEATNTLGQKAASFGAIIVQIGLLDIVFSLDSVITAAGMVKEVGIMIAAVIISMIFMVLFVNKISDFIDKHPSLKMLALSFLIMIGALLVAESFHQEIPKGYVYFAMAFSVIVEVLNIRARTKRAKVLELNKQYR